VHRAGFVSDERGRFSSRPLTALGQPVYQIDHGTRINEKAFQRPVFLTPFGTSDNRQINGVGVFELMNQAAKRSPPATKAIRHRDE
jgi:hypothetical protein